MKGHDSYIVCLSYFFQLSTCRSLSTTNRAKVCGYVALLLSRFPTDPDEIGH